MAGRHLSAPNPERGSLSAEANAALEEFTELRWITVQQLPRQHPV